MNLVIRGMQPTDWSQVAEIYKQGIETGNATFQQIIPTWDEWNHAHLACCRIVAVVDNRIAGWVALSPVSSRPVYAGVAEESVYVGTEYRGLKIGTKLLEAIITASESNGLWTLQTGIFPENKASIAIHTKAGFRQIGYREKVGKMKNTWRNTVLLERRSSVVGID